MSSSHVKLFIYDWCRRNCLQVQYDNSYRCKRIFHFYMKLISKTYVFYKCCLWFLFLAEWSYSRCFCTVRIIGILFIGNGASRRIEDAEEMASLDLICALLKNGLLKPDDVPVNIFGDGVRPPLFSVSVSLC